MKDFIKPIIEKNKKFEARIKALELEKSDLIRYLESRITESDEIIEEAKELEEYAPSYDSEEGVNDALNEILRYMKRKPE